MLFIQTGLEHYEDLKNMQDPKLQSLELVSL